MFFSRARQALMEEGQRWRRWDSTQPQLQAITQMFRWEKNLMSSLPLWMRLVQFHVLDEFLHLWNSIFMLLSLSLSPCSHPPLDMDTIPTIMPTVTWVNRGQEVTDLVHRPHHQHSAQLHQHFTIDIEFLILRTHSYNIIIIYIHLLPTAFGPLVVIKFCSLRVPPFFCWLAVYTQPLIIIM